MAKDRFKTSHKSPWVAWILIGVLLVSAVGLLSVYVLRPERSEADDAQSAAAVASMDEAQREANGRREEKRNSAALLN